jgi:hypothetical protein
MKCGTRRRKLAITVQRSQKVPPSLSEAGRLIHGFPPYFYPARDDLRSPVMAFSAALPISDA